jgi:plasmid stabilization system protein ParE
MKVKISERAKYNRNKIADYILRKFGEKALLDFREEYKRTKKLLAEDPGIGSEELNLSDDEHKYQYTVINGLSIMLYRVENETVYIVDMWDTRQQPPTIVRL